MTAIASESAEAGQKATGILGRILAEEAFRPQLPRNWNEVGLSASLVESLICKHLAAAGSDTGRNIATRLGLPLALLNDAYNSLRTRQIMVHSGSTPLGDYYYKLTDQGVTRARQAEQACAYLGHAPVPLVDYTISVEAQAIGAESVKRRHLEKAFQGVSLPEGLLDLLGPAVNSGAGLFLHGAPGNGKTTLARCITACFSQHIWVPYAIIDDGQIIKVFDAAYHEPVKAKDQSLAQDAEHDPRWICIRRPTVIVGGELTLDSLEIRHDPRSNVSEAPLQMKSNCGCLLVDDFGRQRVEPADLLNRWIVPLENRVDYLTLATGKKITMPFEQMILFSTNLDPNELVDEAFLRRIPYKIHVSDPTEGEYLKLFESCGKLLGCEYREEAVKQLIESQHRRKGCPLRRCQPRDLLLQVRNFCTYHEVPFEMKFEYLDYAAHTYFSGRTSPK